MSLKSAFEAVIARLNARIDMNQRNLDKHREAGLVDCTLGRIGAYRNAIGDVMAFMPAVELPWKLAAREYRYRLLEAEDRLARIERELGLAYDRLEEAVLKAAQNG